MKGAVLPLLHHTVYKITLPEETKSRVVVVNQVCPCALVIGEIRAGVWCGHTTFALGDGVGECDGLLNSQKSHQV